MAGHQRSHCSPGSQAGWRAPYLGGLLGTWQSKKSRLLLKVPMVDCLVGGFKHLLFSISYMGCHPSQLIFFRGLQTTNQVYLLINVSSWNLQIFGHLGSDLASQNRRSFQALPSLELRAAEAAERLPKEPSSPSLPLSCDDFVMFDGDHIIFLGKFHHDLTSRPSPGIIVFLREIIPKWAQQFRLVKYYNLPRNL